MRFRQLLGKEIVLRMMPWHGGVFRGILAGYDDSFVYLYQFQNVVNLYEATVYEKYTQTDPYGGKRTFERVVKDEEGNPIKEWRWNGRGPAEVKPWMAISRDKIIEYDLAEHYPWYETMKLDNPYFLDKWLQREQRKKKNEEFRRRHNLRMVDRRDMIKNSLIAAAVTLSGISGAVWAMM